MVKEIFVDFDPRSHFPRQIIYQNGAEETHSATNSTSLFRQSERYQNNETLLATETAPFRSAMVSNYPNNFIPWRRTFQNGKSTTVRNKYCNTMKIFFFNNHY